MDTIVLKCGTDVTVHACDSIWSADGGSVSAEATIKKEGTHSAKVQCSGSGLQAHAVIGSVDLSATLGILFWVRASESTGAGQFSLLIDNTAACTSPLETLVIPALTGNTWTLLFLPFADPSVLTAIVSVGLKANSASLASVYLDNIRAVDARSYETYGVDGFDTVGQVRLWPGVQNECASGEIRSRATGFGRIITFKMTPKTLKADRVWQVTHFLLAETRVMVFAGEEVSVSLSDAAKPYASEWEGGFVLTPAYTWTLYEQSIRETTPDAWT